MTRVPAEPMHARALLAAAGLGCAGEVACIVAMLAVDNLLFRPRWVAGSTSLVV